MSSSLNPIVSGLLGAVTLASRIKAMALAEAEERRYQEESERRGRNERRERELADLEVGRRLIEIGARPAEAGDLAELETGYRYEAPRYQPGIEQAVTGGPGGFTTPRLAPSDLKQRVVSWRGTRYVLPSEEETEARKDRASRRETERATAKVTAEETARGRTRISLRKEELAETGIRVSPQMQQKLGIQSEFLPAEYMDDYARAAATLGKPAEAEKPHEFITVDQQGGAVLVRSYPVSGKVEQVPLAGTFKTPPKAAAARQETPAQKRTREIAEAASNLLTFAEGDAGDAEKALGRWAHTNDFYRKNRIAILGELRKAKPKQKRIEEMTPEELEQHFSRSFGRDEDQEEKQAPGPKTSSRDAALEFLKKRGVR